MHDDRQKEPQKPDFFREIRVQMVFSTGQIDKGIENRILNGSIN